MTIRYRLFIAATILAILYICYQGMTAIQNIASNPFPTLPATSAPAPEAERTCILLAPAGSTHAWKDLTNTWGTLDYSGGKVYSVAHGTMLGYAAAEYDDLWNLPECVPPA